MNLLDKFVTLAPGAHLDLLQYLLIIALIIFSIYSSVLFGSSLLSLIYNLKSFISKKENHKRIAKDYIDLITPNITMGFGLGIVPFIGLILIYTQLLHETESPVVGYLIYALVIFFISLILLYLYKSAMKKSGNFVFGLLGILFLATSLYIFLSSVGISINSSNGFFSVDTIVKILQSFTISMALIGSAFVIKYYLWDKRPDFQEDDYYKWARTLNLRIAMVFTIAQPVFFVINLFITPKFALSAGIFLFIFIALILVFLSLHSTYSQIRSNKLTGATWSFYILILIFAFMIYKDQLAFGLASRTQIQTLATAYDKEEAEHPTVFTKKAVEIDGGEIYQTKCVACHKFEERFVGPPHKEVMLKYANNHDAMIKFILDPQKVNPDYPQMPAQGLKPNEAKAVVKYMYEHFAEKMK